jgi:hypothetical protein
MTTVTVTRTISVDEIDVAEGSGDDVCCWEAEGVGLSDGLWEGEELDEDVEEVDEDEV